jgi:hypothetical protein
MSEMARPGSIERTAARIATTAELRGIEERTAM